MARRVTSEKARTEAFAEAAAGFIKFADSKPNSPYQLLALSAAGNLYSELALTANNKAENLPAAARRQREQLQKTANKYLDQAKQPLAKLKDQCEAKIKALPKAAKAQKDRSNQANRQQLEGKLAEAKFLLAKLDFEKGRAQTTGSKAKKKTMKSAQEAFAA